MILFFTYRVSLQAWLERGILDRELELYRRLMPRLGQVTFVTYGDTDGALEARLHGIRVLPRPAWVNAPVMSVLAPWIYRRELRTARILKTNQTAGAWTAVLAKWHYRIPLIVRCGYPWSFNYARESSRAWRRGLVHLLERLAVRTADRVVVTSSASADYLVTQHGLDRRRVRVVPNYVDTDVFAPEPGEPRQKDLAVFVGRLSPEKGVTTLVDAAARVPGLRLRVVGDGADREALARRAASAVVPIEFTGTVPNAALPRLLREASVFVLPSLYEGHPKALLEAMACALPVIGSDVPGIAEVIRHRENGWLCRPGDPIGLADALATLVTDEALRTHLGARARADVERHYSVGVVLARELEVIRELVG